MKITYISHSGFAVELEEHVLIFDYYKGNLPEFDVNKKVIVFSSHVHHDHFVKEIFDWTEKYKNIHYILSSDIRKSVKKFIKEQNLEEKITFLLANREYESDGLQVRTIQSTDVGVAFVVKCEGKKIYHAGDLNWWHWAGETEEYNEHMKKIYLRQMKKLKQEELDIAFVPADPRLEEQYYYGIDGLMRYASVGKIFPMHLWDKYSVCEQLRNQKETENYRDKICQISREGEEFCM